MYYECEKSFTDIILESIFCLLMTILIVMLLSTFYLGMKEKVEKMTKIKTIKCYSGNTLIYEGKSTEAIHNVKSNSYEFIELGTNNSMEISGNCIIKYDN